MDVRLVDVGDVLPGEKQLGKVCVHLFWALTWEALRKTQARRYLKRNRGFTFKSAAWFHAVRDHASEQRFRTYFRVSRSTFSMLRDVLWAHARPILRRRRGGAQLALDLQLAITLYRLGQPAMRVRWTLWRTYLAFLSVPLSSLLDASRRRCL